jgi:hypothetical protein
MLSIYQQVIKQSVMLYPGVQAHMSGRALALAGEMIAYKTFDFYLRELTRMVNNLYNGNTTGAEFTQILTSLVRGQLRKAFEQSLTDNGLTAKDMTDTMRSRLDEMTANELSRVEGFAREIVDASIDERPVDQFIARAAIWANRYNDALNEGYRLIEVEKGGKLEWSLGATEEHCVSCSALDGIVAFASEWETSGIRPQSPPNASIECGGWRCDCTLTPTKKRRTANALDRLLDISVAGAV